MLPMDYAMSKKDFFKRYFKMFCNHTKAVISHACSAICAHCNIVFRVYLFSNKALFNKAKYLYPGGPSWKVNVVVPPRNLFFPCNTRNKDEWNN